MSISFPLLAREGLAIEGVEGERGLSFPACVANHIAANYRETVAKDPVVQSMPYMAMHGRPHPMERMLGLPVSDFPVDFRIYEMGDMIDPDGESRGMDLYLAEHPELEGHGLMAYCPSEMRGEILEASTENQGRMSSFVYNLEDLEEILEALGQDFSVLESQEG